MFWYFFHHYYFSGLLTGIGSLLINLLSLLLATLAERGILNSHREIFMMGFHKRLFMRGRIRKAFAKKYTRITILFTIYSGFILTTVSLFRCLQCLTRVHRQYRTVLKLFFLWYFLNYTGSTLHCTGTTDFFSSV